jgi:hypothetical protein
MSFYGGTEIALILVVLILVFVLLAFSARDLLVHPTELAYFFYRKDEAILR